MKTIQIKKILIPLDFLSAGQLALEHGAYMAKLFNAQLYLFHVIEINEFVYAGYESALVIPPDDTKVEDSIKKNLEESAAVIRSKYGVHVIPVVKRGKVAMELAEFALEFKIDLIVMGTHGASGFREYFIGSNAHKIITNAPCPVLTLQAHTPNIGFKNMVVPIDNSLHSRQKVDYVVKLASKYGSFVHVLGLMLQEEEGFVDHEKEEKKFMIKIESVEKLLTHAKIKFDTKILYGNNIAVEALRYSEEINADLIFIMADHESHLNIPVLSAFAKQIINHSQIPVMSIKPIRGNYEVSDFKADNPFEY